jgi:multiple sugar transport system permease protein
VRRGARSLGRGALLGLLVAYSLFPIYMMTIESLKTVREDVYGSPFYVLHPTLEWYETLFEREPWVTTGDKTRPTVPFLVWAGNTMVVFGSGLLVVLLASLAAGYGLGRLRPPGWRWWRRALFATFLLPHTLLFIPLYHEVYRLHLDDSLLSLILVYPLLAIPFCTWLFSAYFQRLSPDIEESAYVEGATRFGAFVRIVLPMSWPVLVAGGLFALGVMSSDFILAGVFLTNKWHQTIAAGVSTMDVSLEELSVVSAASLGGLPVLVLAAALAGSYVRGLTAAMVEGA